MACYSVLLDRLGRGGSNAASELRQVITYEQTVSIRAGSVRHRPSSEMADDTGIIIGTSLFLIELGATSSIRAGVRSLDVHQLDAPCIPLTASKRLLVWTSAARPIRR